MQKCLPSPLPCDVGFTLCPYLSAPWTYLSTPRPFLAAPTGLSLRGSLLAKPVGSAQQVSEFLKKFALHGDHKSPWRIYRFKQVSGLVNFIFPVFLFLIFVISLLNTS